MSDNTFEVTQTMLDSAQETYDNHAEKGQYCHFGPLQYAIEVAIQTSGLLERIAKLKEAGENLALWAYDEVDADPDVTPGLRDMLNLTGHHEVPCPFPPRKDQPYD